ncbi:MAG: hypothetical protein AAGA54_30630 [Myxococcota bacterium]
MATEQDTKSPAARVLAKALRIEWLGQTVASGCWIASVLSYGISSTGDWLQMAAASAWMIANVAALVDSDPEPAEQGA